MKGFLKYQRKKRHNYVFSYFCLLLCTRPKVHYVYVLASVRIIIIIKVAQRRDVVGAEERKMGNTNLREGALAEGGTESPRTAQTPRQRKKKPKTFDDDEWMEAAFSASKDLHSHNGSRIRIREDQERATQLRRSSSDRGIIQPDKDGIRRSINGEGASKTESLSRRRALNRNLGINYSQPPLSARGPRPPSYTPPQTRDRASSMEEGITKQLKSKSALLSGSTTSSPDKATSGLASSSINKKPKEQPTSTPTISPVSTPRDSPRSVRSPRLAQAGSGMSKLWSHSVQHLTKGFKNAQEPDQEGPESHSNSSGESSNQVPVKKTSIRGTRTVRVSPRTPRRTNSTEGDGICTSPKERKAKDEEEEQELPASPRRMEEQEEIRRKPKKSRSKDDLREQLAGDKKSPRAKKKTASVDKDEEVRPSTPKRSKSKKKVLEEEVEETEERDPRRPGSSRSKEDGEKEKEPQQRKRRSRKKKLDADSPRDSPRTARGREKEKEKGEKENEKEEDVKQEVAENKESHSRASRRGTILFYQMMSSGAATLGQQNEGTEEL